MRKALLLVALLAATPHVYADNQGKKDYEVTITNITSGQTFTPLLVVAHTSRIKLFDLGEPAIDELAIIAEGGDIGPMDALLGGLRGKVGATASSGGLLGPGESVTVKLKARSKFNRISVVGMLIPTNDTFVALDSVVIRPWEKDYLVPAFDAGSEFNDELCGSIPGPVCGGEGYSDVDGEGYVHISGGIRGIGDLEPASYDWRNPVAKISLESKR